MGEMMERPSAAMLEARAAMEAMTGQLREMAMLLRATHERMSALEKEVRRLTKVTPGQAAALNAAIRQRAGAVCRMHRCPWAEKAAGAAIRKAVRTTMGVGSMREMPRDDYNIAMKAIGMWDDYEIMTRLKQKGEGQ